MKHWRIFFVVLWGNVFSLYSMYAESSIIRSGNILFNITDHYVAEVVDVIENDNSIIIPDSIRFGKLQIPVVSIKENAFKACPSADTIVLPKCITHIYRSTFEKTHFYQNKKNWTKDGFLFIGNVLIACKDSKVKEVFTMPKGITTYAIGALGKNNDLEELTIPDGVVVLPSCGLSGCKNLNKIYLPRTIERIEKDALAGTAIMRDKTRYVGGVLYVGPYALACDSYLSHHLIIRSGTRILADGLCNNHRELHQVTLPMSLEKISDDAFSYCCHMEKIEMGEHIRQIGQTAFIGCERISEICFSDSLRTICNGAFYNCTSLKTIVFPKHVEVIGDGAFYYCTNLDSVVFPETLREIGESAFNNSGIRSIKLGSSLEVLGMGCFFQCQNLKIADLGCCTKLRSIPRYGFKRCKSLHTVILPSKKVHILAEAFKEDNELQTYLYSNSE